MHAFTAAALALALAVSPALAGEIETPPAKWTPARITATSFALTDRGAPDDAAQAGQLVYRGGLVLTADDPRFGGFSGLRVSADGRRLLALSDRGAWLQADVVYDAAGRLSGLVHAQMSDLHVDPSLETGYALDSEGLDTSADGSILISFERVQRIDAYARDAEGRIGFSHSVLRGEAVSMLPDNGGLEGVARLADGRVLAIAERGKGAARPAFLVSNGKTTSLAYTPAGGFNPTDLAPDPDGGVYVLERGLSPWFGFRARITHVAGADIRAGATLSGVELTRLGAGDTLDNMEGLSARTDDSGRTFLYMVSDDNHKSFQRTLLMMFEIADQRSFTAVP